jgi:hypothetical protein
VPYIASGPLTGFVGKGWVSGKEITFLCGRVSPKEGPFVCGRVPPNEGPFVKFVCSRVTPKEGPFVLWQGDSTGRTFCVVAGYLQRKDLLCVAG